MKPITTFLSKIMLGAALLGGLALNHSAHAGVVAGPRIAHEVVLPRMTDVFNFWCEGGEMARVSVIGDGSSDLDLYVYDENGNLITSDTDTTDACFVTFYPFWTGRFRIEIRNLGWGSNLYTITTN